MLYFDIYFNFCDLMMFMFDTVDSKYMLLPSSKYDIFVFLDLSKAFDRNLLYFIHEIQSFH